MCRPAAKLDPSSSPHHPLLVKRNANLEIHDMSKTVGELLVDTLAQAGVNRIYGVAGDSLNAITDVLRRRGSVQWIHVRHEEAAAFAAGDLASPHTLREILNVGKSEVLG
jgi:hypothetical protein